MKYVRAVVDGVEQLQLVCVVCEGVAWFRSVAELKTPLRSS
jgi:hypothetical protein